MASFLYNSAVEDMARGNIDFDTDVFHAFLVTGSYVPNKRTHSKRSAASGAEVSGTGYTAGGIVVAVTITRDDVNDRVDIGLPGGVWANSTISAVGAVYCKWRAGAATADELVGFIDLGGTIASSNGPFTLTGSTFRIAVP